MQRNTIIVGNWKMNSTVSQAKSMLSEIKSELSGLNGIEIVVCPPFTALYSSNQILNETSIKIGAQDIFYESNGAFTGAISCEMVSELCGYAIVGHSERRSIFSETDASVQLKVSSGINSGLKVIMCVGEGLDDRESGKANSIVREQVKQGTLGLTSISKLLIAYEPVWAIGSGIAATAEDAQNMMRNIRTIVAEEFGNESRKIQLLYGGSVTDTNIDEYLCQPDIDGALVGGASLIPQKFVQIIRNAANTVKENS